MEIPIWVLISIGCAIAFLVAVILFQWFIIRCDTTEYNELSRAVELRFGVRWEQRLPDPYLSMLPYYPVLVLSSDEWQEYLKTSLHTFITPYGDHHWKNKTSFWRLCNFLQKEGHVLKCRLLIKAYAEHFKGYPQWLLEEKRLHKEILTQLQDECEIILRQRMDEATVAFRKAEADFSRAKEVYEANPDDGWTKDGHGIYGPNLSAYIRAQHPFNYAKIELERIRKDRRLFNTYMVKVKKEKVA